MFSRLDKRDKQRGEFPLFHRLSQRHPWSSSFTIAVIASSINPVLKSSRTSNSAVLSPTPCCRQSVQLSAKAGDLDGTHPPSPVKHRCSRPAAVLVATSHRRSLRKPSARATAPSPVATRDVEFGSRMDTVQPVLAILHPLTTLQTLQPARNTHFPRTADTLRPLLYSDCRFCVPDAGQ